MTIPHGAAATVMGSRGDTPWRYHGNTTFHWVFVGFHGGVAMARCHHGTAVGWILMGLPWISMAPTVMVSP